MYLQLHDNVNMAKTRLSKAKRQYSESDFTGSEISVFNALRVLKGEEENNILYDSYNLLGLVYNELGEYNKAIEYHSKALNSLDDKTPIEFQSKASSLNNIGIVYQIQNQDQNQKEIQKNDILKTN